MSDRMRQSMGGQTIAIFALMLVGLMGFSALALDGGNALHQRRITQNAADASALGGLWFIVKTEDPSQKALLARIHKVTEAHGIPDSDGIPLNAVNDNITIYYTDHEGNHLFGCNQAPCDDGIPSNTQGLQVEISQGFSTFVAGIIGRSRTVVSASAVAVLIARHEDIFTQGITFFALADSCQEDATPFDVSGQNNELIGTSHSNSHYLVGAENHFHGSVSYVGNINDDLHGSYFLPDSPIKGDLIDLPAALAPLSVDDFGPGMDAVIHLTPTINYFDISGPEYGDPIKEDELTDPRPSIGMPQLFNPTTGIFRPGVYFAGDKRIDLSWSDTYGEVTFISHNFIDISGSSVHIKSFHDSGILLYTDYQPSDPCTEMSVLLQGGSNGMETWVSHNDGCPVVDPDENCWGAANKIYEGLVYAPRGKVAVGSGSHIAFMGGIIAWTIRLSGSDSVYVGDPLLFSPTNPYILLYE